MIRNDFPQSLYSERMAGHRKIHKIERPKSRQNLELFSNELQSRETDRSRSKNFNIDIHPGERHSFCFGAKDENFIFV